MKRFQSNSLLEAIALCLNQNREVEFRAVRTLDARGIDIMLTVKEIVPFQKGEKVSQIWATNKLISAESIKNLGAEKAWTMAVDMAREDFEQEDKQI